MMTRHDALMNASARHPLRRSLPPPGAIAVTQDEDKDLKLFVLSFTAFFICFYTFLA